MNDHSTPVVPLSINAQSIRTAREENPKMRERELAVMLGISEAEYVAACCGISATRIEPRVNDVLNGLEALGEVMALTRNDSAVHEKIGVYDKVHTSERGAIVLGEDIDLRIFHKNWVHGFAVEKRDGESVNRSLQFFDASGEAVHKIHLRPSSDVAAYEQLVAALRSENQCDNISVENKKAEAEADTTLSEEGVSDMRDKWAAMTDVHQFVGILRKFGLTRHQAISAIDDEFAWRLDDSALVAMLNLAVGEEIPIMCFVGSTGVIQIHTGPVREIKPMGPWINILDPKFHLHLRLDHIAELWAVRKPNRDGHVTSLEAYDSNKKLIIQFFGKRQEGTDERPDWRLLMENLPKLPGHVAA
ncbi:hemin-degrading factor [Hoeflea sp. TYP-13]|uniref:hemin-degrading factor n=1 Tax=Hoeflea sp. TYP-13 TaxID=3230023 RepID=UPI0034C5DD4F